MKPPPKLPEHVLGARRRYIRIKIESGYCADLTCANTIEQGQVRCARCLGRIAAADERRRRDR
jgi:hypothetical protein